MHYWLGALERSAGSLLHNPNGHATLIEVLVMGAACLVFASSLPYPPLYIWRPLAASMGPFAHIFF